MQFQDGKNIWVELQEPMPNFPKHNVGDIIYVSVVKMRLSDKYQLINESFSNPFFMSGTESELLKRVKIVPEPQNNSI